MAQEETQMVPRDVVRDSVTNAGSEDVKDLTGLKRYVVALALFRCFSRPFVLC